MPQTSLERIIYVSILITYLVIATLFAWRVPAWQAPDEPAHYNYISQVSTGDLLPVIETGDWDNDYLEELKANDFAPAITGRLSTVQYENHQPPLYYWLAAPVFLLTNGSLFAVRMVSVFMGLMTIILSYTVANTLFSERSYLSLAVMCLIAFLPQNVHILASVNNDALAYGVIAAMLLLCIQYLKDESLPTWWLGISVGIAFITKTTTYFMAGIVLIVIFIRWWLLEEHDVSVILKRYLKFAIPASVSAFLYWGRNILTYGFPDFLGLQAHDAIVVGQQRRIEFIEQNGIGTYWREAIDTTFNSFWGQFGWMEARLGDAVPAALWFIVVLLVIALTGLVVNIWTARFNNQDLTAKNIKIQNAIGVTLSLMLLLAIAQYIYYNVTFVQFQGRYLFVALIPFAIAIAVGIDSWRRLLLPHVDFAKWVVVIVFALFVPLDIYLIWRVIPCAVGCL